MIQRLNLEINLAPNDIGLTAAGAKVGKSAAAKVQFKRAGHFNRKLGISRGRFWLGEANSKKSALIASVLKTKHKNDFRENRFKDSPIQVRCPLRTLDILPEPPAQGGTMSGLIFISYRREDAAPSAGRLYDRLSRRFRPNRIFFDVDNIPPGVDFVKEIERSVGSCDVLVAVIGKRWVAAADEDGGRRLDNRDDFVRLEIETALKRGIGVIPVLVDGVSMPRAGELPDELKSLVRLQAVKVSQDRFRSDADSLIVAVEQALKEARSERRKRGLPRPRRRVWLSIAGAVTMLALVTIAFIYFSSHPLKLTAPEVRSQPSAEQSPAIVAPTPTQSEEPAQLASNPGPKPSRTPVAVTEEKVPPAVQALIEQLKDPDADARHAAATSLGTMGVNAKAAVPALIQRVADDVWGSQDNPVNTDNAGGNTSKDAALKALKQLAPDRVEEALIKGTKSTNPLTRKWASAQLAVNP